MLKRFGGGVIKREPTIEEHFENWRLQKHLYTFSHALFETINRANLQESEQLRLGFPEYLKTFEDYYGANLALNKEDIVADKEC
jgi:hypothetical protein